MVFDPAVDQQLVIDGTTYTFTAHPVSREMPYGQEGRQATVYQLADGSSRYALKVFKPAFRYPGLVSLADRLAPFAEVPGLAVCRRVVLSGRRHEQLLRPHPELIYAVLMPWMEGPTWMQVMLEKRELQLSESLRLARGLAECLADMEERRLAHCDLSAPNVILPCLASAADGSHSPVSLVDVEQLYGPGLDKPEALPGGSPGYAHSTAGAGAWEARADRFAAAVLIAEILCWSDERVRNAAWGESYFEPGEEGKECERARLLAQVLSEKWGEKATSLFDRAWTSTSLSECPTFGEWLLALPERVEEGAATSPKSSEDVGSLLLRAGQLELAGDLPGAAAAYHQALQQLSGESSLHQEVKLILARLQDALEHQKTLEQRASQAKSHEAAGQWREAALLYEALLAEKACSPGQRAAWEEGLKWCREEAELAELFGSALELRGQGQERAARELLAEVVRRRPDYERGGETAAALLAGGKKRSGRLHALAPRWPLLVAGLVVLALLVGAGALFQAQYQGSSQAGTATAIAARDATTSALAESARMVEAAALRAATAMSEGTATASVQGTAQARGTAEAVAAATKSAATGTALAQAAGATATAQAALQAQATQSAASSEATAQAQGARASASAEDQQTAIAQTQRGSATAAAQRTATVQVQAQQTAAAQSAAQATSQARQTAGGKATPVSIWGSAEPAAIAGGAGETVTVTYQFEETAGVSANVTSWTYQFFGGQPISQLTSALRGQAANFRLPAGSTSSWSVQVYIDPNVAARAAPDAATPANGRLLIVDVEFYGQTDTGADFRAGGETGIFLKP